MECQDCGKSPSCLPHKQCPTDNGCGRTLCSSCLQYVLKIDKSQSFCKKCFKKLCNLDFSVHEVVLGPKEAKTIVFVHGGGGCRNMFAHHARLLSKDYRCVLVDLPGHGTRMEEPLSLQTAIQVIVDTTRKHASPNHPKIYVGGSLGGYIGMELLGQHPKLFDAAVITMCGQAVGKQNRGYAAYFGLLMMDTFASLFSQKMLFDSMIQQAQQNGHISEQLLEEMVYKSGFYFGQAKEQIQILKDSNPVPSLFKFDGRVMFVNGSKDHRDSEQLWLKTCKKGELHVLDGADHFFSHDDRYVDRFMQLLRAFFEK